MYWVHAFAEGAVFDALMLHAHFIICHYQALINLFNDFAKQLSHVRLCMCLSAINRSCTDFFFFCLLLFMSCSLAASKVSHAQIMKCDTGSLSGLQAQLTLIQLCSTSKGSGFVIL